MLNNRNLLLILAISAVSVVSTQTISAQTAADNSGVNKRDRKSTAMTADKQKVNAADQGMTRKIRKSLMADKSLSTYAHNIKIITAGGMVTLKGPVKSDDEKKSVMAKAVAIAGSADKVTDQISVTP